MRYPIIATVLDFDHYQIQVPDMPGCLGAGISLDEAMDNIRVAMDDYLLTLAERGERPPHATSLDEVVGDQTYEEGILGFVDIDTVPYMGMTEKINVTLPTLLVKKIDQAVRHGHGKNRSAFLAEAALEQIHRLFPR
ncbi:Uncharacterised protein [BD1-7 clade bacterium]|uniref:HicB-like antitoxin of toxin-antitoxin system domain-containing protein n=1 Tax=BD1-7 clade bacterium TaxID=2029982 RepID=A0A5S9PA30_9GAMM|nr:Uncharacterised protein [BD1-7 clade bacterium]CAA0101433.1 Uncharacterised protein [BD1-7 clade bacterium]